MGGGLRQCAAAGDAAIRAGQPSDACRGRGCTQVGKPGQQQQVSLHADAVHVLHAASLFCTASWEVTCGMLLLCQMFF